MSVGEPALRGTRSRKPIHATARLGPSGVDRFRPVRRLCALASKVVVRGGQRPYLRRSRGRWSTPRIGSKRMCDFPTFWVW